MDIIEASLPERGLLVSETSWFRDRPGSIRGQPQVQILYGASFSLTKVPMFETKHMRRVAVVVGGIAFAAVAIWGGPFSVIALGVASAYAASSFYEDVLKTWIDAGDDDFDHYN